MTVDIYDVTQADGLSLEELTLYHLINDYRIANNLAPIALSNSLTVTAGRHALDTLYNIWEAGLVLPAGAGLHSWSDAPYYDDHSDPSVMWYAPQRLGTGYITASYEISAAGFDSIQDAFVGWQGSASHNDVILTQNNWAGRTFNAMGIGVESDPSVSTYGGKVYNVWFGTVDDPAGAPVIYGDDTDDTILGTTFADEIQGGLGNDVI
ncbi:MAG: calcium-binding protein, partial [Rhodobacteraceae bacterium]|nr:calcium-binding protein [Paracoccaceae bacterium]